MNRLRRAFGIAALAALPSMMTFGQCNTNTSICTPGTAGPFTFVTPGSYVSTCLDWIGPNTGYIILHITASGPLNMLIDGNSSYGFLDVAVFNIPAGQSPCTAIQNTSNQIGCNYASASSGCNQFGTSFPCSSSVPAPYVTAGQELMIVVENWSGSSSNFTLQLGPAPGAQTGPPNPAITPVGPFCTTSPAVQLIAADMGGTWSGAGVSPTGMFNPATAGVGPHTINYSIGVAPCNASSSTTITVNSATVSVSPSTSICAGGSATLTASGAATYTWSPTTGLSPTTGATVTASPASTTTYTVTGTTAGCTSTANVTVTVGGSPAVNAVANQSYCAGATAPVTAFSGGSTGTVYNWTNSNPAIGLGASGTGSLPSFTATNSTTSPITATITVTPTVGVCTGTPMTFTITVNSSNTTVSPSTSICSGGSATLTAAGATSYSWSPTTGLSPTTGATVTASPTTTATYTVTGTTAGCTSTANVTVTVGGSPAVNAVPNQSYCAGATTPATVFSGGSTGTVYSWTNSNPAIGLGSSGTGSLPSYTATNSTTSPITATITVTPSVGTCTGTPITFTITINGSNTTVSPDASICNGGSTTLTAAGATSYSWSPTTGLSPTTGATVTASPSATTTYTVTGTTAGCTSTANVTVTVGGTPSVNAVANQSYCAGASVPATAFSGGATGTVYDWTNSNPAIGLAASGTGTLPAFTGTNSTASPITATITVTPSIGTCVGTPITFTITINPQPTVTASNNGPLCQGSQLNLTASTVTGGTYSWSGPNGFTSTLQNPSIASTGAADFGTYTVTVTTSGCSALASTTVVLTPGTQPTLTPAGPFCANSGAVTLIASVTGGTWSGTGITNAASGLFDPAAATTGSNTITYTLANGCVNPVTTNIVVNPLPVVQFSSNQLTGCIPLSVTLTDQSVPASTTNSWNFGDGFTAAGSAGSVSHEFTAAGCYDITLISTASTGCSNTTTLTNYICAIPQADASFTVNDATQTISDPTFQFLNTSQNASIYSWDFGDGSHSAATNPNHTYGNTPGSYTIMLYADNAGGCRDSATLTVLVEDELIFHVPNAFTPDGDEYNNTFQPVFYSGFDPYNFSLVVYDRWGEILFESNDATIGWDGTYAGASAKEGLYTWTIRFKDSTTDRKRVYAGHVALIR